MFKFDFSANMFLVLILEAKSYQMQIDINHKKSGLPSKRDNLSITAKHVLEQI